MGNNINLYNVLEYCLKLVTREDEVTLTNVLRIINLQSFILEKLMARTLFGMLKDYPVLRDLYETITFYTPFALKDVFDMIYQKPLQVAYIAMDWLSGDGGWKGICQLDLSELGRDFNISIARLCSVDEMAFVADIRRFFHLEVFEGTWQPYSLNTTISNSLDKWKQLQLMIENGTYQRDYFDAGLYLGLEQWRAMPSLVFNVSFDTLWENRLD
ncbi:hypothetical protein SK128_027393 [Halocaridina rubra]|uniref:Uncharacterized protein n=1 Tax=Halocaridina rubra TaxID=373956 RepID=A0AAN9AC67_HALRR